jgi:DNA gyrase subunit B
VPAAVTAEIDRTAEPHPAHQPPPPRQHQELHPDAGVRASHDYAALADEAQNFVGLLGEGAKVTAAKAKSQDRKGGDFRQAMPG